MHGEEHTWIGPEEHQCRCERLEQPRHSLIQACTFIVNNGIIVLYI